MASAPAAWICMQSPRNAFFGNFVYPSLNTEYHRDNIGTSRQPFTVLEKTGYLAKNLVALPGNGVVVILFILFMARVVRIREVPTDARQCELLVIAVMVVTLAVAGFAPTPMYRQYVYAATPFMILGLTLCLGTLKELADSAAWQRTLGGCLALTVGFGIVEYDGIVRLPTFRRWVPVQVHDAGVTIAKQVAGDGPVLTLAPIYALEGGMRIHEELAVGRFGLRVSGYLSPTQQAQYGMQDSDNIEELFERQPPEAVLIAGTNKELEERLVRHAVARGYQEMKLAEPLVLWKFPHPPRAPATLPGDLSGMNEPLR